MGDGEWSETDSVLALARQIDEEAKCGRCGHYHDEAWSTGDNDFFSVDDSTLCHACAAVERWEKENPSDHRDAGLLIRAVDTRREDIDAIHHRVHAPTSAPRSEGALG